MSKFKSGDKVRRKDGITFSNNNEVVTVGHTSGGYSSTKVWFKETGTYLREDEIELVSNPVNEVQEVIETKIKKLKEEITLLETALSVIKKIGDR